MNVDYSIIQINQQLTANVNDGESIINDPVGSFIKIKIKLLLEIATLNSHLK